jgi:hypothetical protein
MTLVTVLFGESRLDDSPRLRLVVRRHDRVVPFTVPAADKVVGRR